MSKSGRGDWNCMRGIFPAEFISSKELNLEYANIPKAKTKSNKKLARLKG